MPDENINLIPPPVDPKAPKTPEEFEQLEEQRKAAERVADEAAGQAGETERRYDQGHDLFTK
jgi:hypothetical protein